MSRPASSSEQIPKWVLDLQSPVPAKAKSGSILDPPGFSAQSQGSSSSKPKRDGAKDGGGKPSQKTAPSPEEMDTLKVKKAWEVALAPIKQLPMTFFMMYMSGNSLQIFSIMMVFMAFKNPVMGIIGTAQAFERFETDSNRAKMFQVKAAYVAMQVLALALGVWKVNGMGLLPTTRSDWLAWEAQRESLESAVLAA